ncbi:MAG: hypothetical protein HYZ00_07665, partial [Candidatus Hydrogenedentes bacterium]|nr:hypothetical protein [Candidatus Hydrogenedentota bacterium]
MQLLASPESRAQRKRLLQAYHALGQPEKSVLQFLSVLYEPIYRYKLAEALATAKIHHVNGQPFGEHDCKKTLSLLKKSGLLDASDSYQPRCLELIAEPVTRDTIREGKFPALVAAAEKASPIEHVFKYSYGQFRSADQGIRALRQYLYLQDVEKFWKSLGLLPKNYGSTSFGVEVLLRICADPFDPDWFKTLRAELAGPILAAVLTESSDRLLSISGPMRFLEENWAKAESADQRESYGSLLTIQLIFRGRLEEAQALVEGMQGSCSSEALGLLAFLRGEFGEALQCYERAMARQRVATGKRKVTLSGHDSIFYALALIRS